MVQSGSTSSGEQPHTQKISRLHRTSCNVGATVGKVTNLPEIEHGGIAQLGAQIAHLRTPK